MRPEPGQVLHFSEDPTITRFVPHVAATSHEPVEPVEPLGPAEPVGDLLHCHADAGIQLRVLDNLWPFWDIVIDSAAGFSAIRLSNARPRPTA